MCRLKLRRLKRRFIRLFFSPLKNPFYAPTQKQIAASHFRAVAVQGRAICSWDGVLPRSPHIRHSLILYDIRRDTPRAKLGDHQPFRVSPANNVDLVLGCRYLAHPKYFRLLFRCQLDLRIPRASLDEICESVALAIALDLYRATTADRLIEYSDDWMLTIEAVYRVELRAALAAIGVSLERFNQDPEFYRRQYIE
jgi:hypothetical protein